MWNNVGGGSSPLTTVLIRLFPALEEKWQNLIFLEKLGRDFCSDDFQLKLGISTCNKGKFKLYDYWQTCLINNVNCKTFIVLLGGWYIVSSCIHITKANISYWSIWQNRFPNIIQMHTLKYAQWLRGCGAVEHGFNQAGIGLGNTLMAPVLIGLNL